MATDESGTHLWGALVPDPRLTYAKSYSASLSTGLTQAGPRPGTAEAYTDGQTSGLVIETSGEQDADTDWRVQVARAGMPGISECGVHLYDDSASPAVGPIGWEPPVCISGWEALAYTTSSVFSEPHAVRLADGDVLLVYRNDFAGELQCRRYDADADTWGAAVTIVSTTLLGTGDFSPTVCQLPDGRILCAYWVHDTSANVSQVAVRSSADAGDTWSIWAPHTLQYDIDLTAQTPHRMRMAYLDGQILLLASLRWSAGTYHDRWRQWASDDLGCTFVEIEDSDGSTSLESASRIDLVIVDGRFLVAYLEVDNTTSGYPSPVLRALSDAYTPLSSVETLDTFADYWGTQGGGGKYVDAGDLALAVDEDGAVYLYGRYYAPGHQLQGVVYRSEDGGVSWRLVSAGTAIYPWWDCQDTATYPKDFCAVAQGGRVMMPCSFASNPDTHDGSACVLYLGGYTTLALPARSRFAAVYERVTYSRMGLPWDLPENTGGLWSLSTTGVPAAPALSNAALYLITLAAETIVYTTAVTPSGSIADGMIVEAECQVTQGTAVLEVRIGDAADGYEVQLNVTGTSIVLLDTVAASTLGTATTTAGATGVSLRVAIAGTAVTAWWCASGRFPHRVWTQIGTSSSLTSTGAASSHQIRFRQDAVAIVNWLRYPAWVSDTYVGRQLATGQSSTELLPRALTTLPTTIAGRLRIRGLSGPGRVGDAWSIRPRYEYGVEHLHPDVSPSPARRWRSVDTSVDAVIGWDVGAAGDTGLLSPLAGLYVGGVNWRSATLQGRSGGVWTTLATIDTAVGTTGLYFVRDGDTLRVDTGTAHAATRYFAENILAGSHVKLTSGGTSVYRTIAGNTGGAWSSSTTKRPVLRLSDAELGDPASGTMEIWSKEALVLWHQPIATYNAYRLVIPAGSTAEGYFEVGVRVLGRGHAYGTTYGWGRIVTLQPNTSVSTARGGARRSRVLGASRRIGEMAWMDGVETSGVGGSSPVPNYITGYTGSSAPVAAVSGTPWDLRGVVEECAGADVPVVLFTRLPRSASSSDTIQVADRERILYSRWMSAPRLESVLGDEWGNPGEIIRVATVASEEEL